MYFPSQKEDVSVFDSESYVLNGYSIPINGFRGALSLFNRKHRFEDIMMGSNFSPEDLEIFKQFYDSIEDLRKYFPIVQETLREPVQFGKADLGKFILNDGMYMPLLEQIQVNFKSVLELPLEVQSIDDIKRFFLLKNKMAIGLGSVEMFFAAKYLMNLKGEYLSDVYNLINTKVYDLLNPRLEPLYIPIDQYIQKNLSEVELFLSTKGDKAFSNFIIGRMRKNREYVRTGNEQENRDLNSAIQKNGEDFMKFQRSILINSEELRSLLKEDPVHSGLKFPIGINKAFELLSHSNIEVVNLVRKLMSPHFEKLQGEEGSRIIQHIKNRKRKLELTGYSGYSEQLEVETGWSPEEIKGFFSVLDTAKPFFQKYVQFMSRVNHVQGRISLDDLYREGFSHLVISEDRMMSIVQEAASRIFLPSFLDKIQGALNFSESPFAYSSAANLRGGQIGSVVLIPLQSDGFNFRKLREVFHEWLGHFAQDTLSRESGDISNNDQNLILVEIHPYFMELFLMDQLVQGEHGFSLEELKDIRLSKIQRMVGHLFNNSMVCQFEQWIDDAMPHEIQSFEDVFLRYSKMLQELYGDNVEVSEGYKFRPFIVYKLFDNMKVLSKSYALSNFIYSIYKKVRDGDVDAKRKYLEYLPVVGDASILPKQALGRLGIHIDDDSPIVELLSDLESEMESFLADYFPE